MSRRFPALGYSLLVSANKTDLITATNANGILTISVIPQHDKRYSPPKKGKKGKNKRW